MEVLTLISVNVRGIRDRIKRKNIFEWTVKSKGGDVIFLQETYSTQDIEHVWKQDWGGQMFFSHGSSHSKGVLVLLSPEVKIKIDQVKVDDGGCYIFLKGDILDSNLILGNVYFPTRDKTQQQIQFLDKIDLCISDLHSCNYSLILGGGDFNVILDESLDYMGPSTPSKTHFTSKIEIFLRKHNIVDIWRKKHIQN